MEKLSKRMVVPIRKHKVEFDSRGTANNPLNNRDLFKMINAMADAIEELQAEVFKKDKD